MTTTDTESVTVPDDLSDVFHVHYWCRLCYPEPKPGVKALCGARLMGIKAPPGIPVCDTCTGELVEHTASHWGW